MSKAKRYPGIAFFAAVLAILLVLCVATARAGIYRWVDENGTVHFSDKPSAENAEQIRIKETGIAINEAADDSGEDVPEAADQPGPQSAEKKDMASESRALEEHEVGEITEADYQISTTISTLRPDLVSISGRIGSGPACYDMSVTATASNASGVTVRISDRVRKSSSFGSVTFKGTVMASANEEQLDDAWAVDSVIVRCNDDE